ncbi:MAG: YkgJ family cysteine cluster protein [Armatimonadota bacterium]
MIPDIKLVKDPAEVERLAAKKESENFKFREFLKGHLDWSDEELDAVIHEVAGRVSKQIDCTACANCCRAQGVGVEDDDINRLAGRLGISSQEFHDQYVSRNDWNERMISQTPCPFLDGCLCSVCEDRPIACWEYPHLFKEEMRFRSLGLISNASYCPIVFNTLEMLKRRLRWRRR